MNKLLLLMLFCAPFIASAQTSITWSAGMNIANSSYGNLHPRIVTDATGNPVVIWGRSSDESVFISRWNGSAFSTPMKVNPSWLTVATSSWMGPDIAAKGDTVYVVMKQTPEVGYPIYLSTSFDGGTTFSTPVQVDFIADSISRFPTVAVNNQGNPVIGFMKFNPDFSNARWVVATSNDFGNTFSMDVKASGWSGGNATVCDCCPGSITCNGNTVAMLYRDNLSNIRDMWAGISTDGGNSFTQGMSVDQGNWMLMMCPSSGPDGVIIGDTLYTAYMSGATGMDLVYFSKSSLSAITGAAGTPLTGTFMGLAIQNFPRIASAGNAVAVTWKQNVDGADQLALQFTNNILNGLPAAYDTVDLGDVTNADIALTDGDIFLVWEDDNSGTVKYRKGTFTPATGIDVYPNENSMVFFPNPFSEALTIQLAGSADHRKISVTSVLGQEIFSKQVSGSENNIQVNASEWNSGVYFVILQAGKITSIQKICKGN